MYAIYVFAGRPWQCMHVCTLYRLYIDMQQMFRYGLVYNAKQCKYTAFVHMHLQEKNTKKRLKLKA